MKQLVNGSKVKPKGLFARGSLKKKVPKNSERGKSKSKLETSLAKKKKKACY